MAALGYRPNRAARALANGMDRAVTVLTSNTNLFGYAETLGGIEEAARAAGVHVAIRVLPSDSAEDIAAAVDQVSDPRSRCGHRPGVRPRGRQRARGAPRLGEVVRRR